MKNKKGYTLIELLAVIIVLAIIALISVPVIINMIEKSKRKAAEDSTLGYIDAINYNNELASMNEYTTGYEMTPTGDDIDVDEISIKMKGKKPTSGTVDISSSGKVTGLSVSINGYDVTSTDGKVVRAEGKSSGTATVTLTKAVFESNDTTWAMIKSSVSKNKIGSDLVGAERTISMDVNGDNTNETYKLRVVNTSECDENVASESACDLVIEFVDELNETNGNYRKMNYSDHTTSGGWPGSEIYAYLNTTIYNKLPNDLKNAIKKTKVVSGYGSSDNTNFTSYDYLYLLSTTEIGINESSDTARNSTRKLDFYDEGTDPTAKNKRIKYKYGLPTEQNTWWLRSPKSGKNGFFNVESGGTIFCCSGSTQERGVTPAFRIG